MPMNDIACIRTMLHRAQAEEERENGQRWILRGILDILVARRSDELALRDEARKGGNYAISTCHGDRANMLTVVIGDVTVLLNSLV